MAVMITMTLTGDPLNMNRMTRLRSAAELASAAAIGEASCAGRLAASLTALARRKNRVSEQDQKRREDAAGDQAIDKTVSEIERADRHQRDDGGGDEQNTRHRNGLTPGQQQKGEEDQKRDNEKQNERRLHENLSNEHAEDAAGRHEDGEADGLLKI